MSRHFAQAWYGGGGSMEKILTVGAILSFFLILTFLVPLKDLQKSLGSFKYIKCAMHSLAHKIVAFVIWFQRRERLPDS